LKSSFLEEISHPLVEFLTALALAPIIYYGGSQVLVERCPQAIFWIFYRFPLDDEPH
jgi:hypothetical protein